MLRQDLDEFFDFALPERFFIKNLERVQGDERDAIIFSVGYAKDRAGNLPHRFGPITQDTGHRRLNVAVSRARQRMTVVSSFRWDKIGLKRSGSRGVEFLRNFLRYAESGGVVLSDEGEAPVPLNSFEKDIFDELTAAGLPLTPQYGCSGYRIDMVASHPHRPGRHVLAIECDGASYHSSPIARERDRIRQQVLVSLGWQFHRIWSTDWWNQREIEVQRVLEAYERAVRDADSGVAPSTPESNPSSTTGIDEDGEPDRAERQGTRPYLTKGLEIGAYRQHTLVALVHYLQSDGRLRTDAELLDEMVAELGFSRKGSRIVRILKRAIAAAT